MQRNIWITNKAMDEILPNDSDQRTSHPFCETSFFGKGENICQVGDTLRMSQGFSMGYEDVLEGDRGLLMVEPDYHPSALYVEVIVTDVKVVGDRVWVYWDKSSLKTSKKPQFTS